MPYIPLLGRLTPREYTAVLLGTALLLLETVLTRVVALLPTGVIRWFYARSRELFDALVGPPAPRRPRQREEREHMRHAERIRRAPDFGALCELSGVAYEEHVVRTSDGYLLGLHRIPPRAWSTSAPAGTRTRPSAPVVYLHHGLLMNSEVWVCLTTPARSLALTLSALGFDVWLGNNRGNKYSRKSVHHPPSSDAFWDYSIDEFAWADIPESIAYILRVTGEPSLSYIGFSQGTAQAFAALSVNHELNRNVNAFLALAPAMSPAGLAPPLVDALMKASPALLFLVFGRRAILSSAHAWQAVLYPPLFGALISASLKYLFKWQCRRISADQRHAAYAHLYSACSVKSVVHWFQIMRTGVFSMYDDETDALAPKRKRAGVTSYAPLRFPTRNISAPVLLLYGNEDSLVDIDIMLRELPAHTRARRLHGYEHLDVLWGADVHVDVIPEVLGTLKAWCVGPERVDWTIWEKEFGGVGVEEVVLSGKEEDAGLFLRVPGAEEDGELGTVSETTSAWGGDDR
ncbi:alpha/beta-hydrolase [Wolfiporia cocos MD-104 SS10]|uniref:Alpha/beta-hydrolase n=1 Tax=Wolfiporia cocos (strain MD-104) TaxID=742152 RepID=A0A2H3JL47_WOLCO|nr:alpha/beta-hydrolase [Wolfiporia cocos MD-104 SS10]